MAYKGNDKCIEKAADNEMLFVLRAQDITSPWVVMKWIELNFENASEEKLREAFEAAMHMRKWAHRKRTD